jgi:outer membrane scaffolding protein for murein synthesis (MipA/OmpV family)
VSLVLASAPAAAQEAARIPITDAPPGTSALGGGVRAGSSPFEDANAELDLVPLYLYEGKWLFAHGTSAGAHFYRDKRFSFDGLVRYRFLNLDRDDDDSLEGLREREQTLDGGFAFSFRGKKWGSVQAAWVADLLDRHSGQETELTYRYRFDRGRWVFSPWVSLEWWSNDLADYYFGVAPGEATPERPVYDPGGAFNLGYGVNTLYKWSETIEIFANVGFREWDNDIVDSPLASEAISTAVFVGSTYTFGNVYGPAKGASPKRERERAWRINYGYQTEGNIVGEVDQGGFKGSESIDTNIAGVMYSHLLTEGPRVDFLGRLALYRHFEEPYQDDFNSYAAYIMAMGKGYLRWTERPFFRWGFGFGFDYAERIPGQEVIEGEKKDRETAKFLNYLEMQADFSIEAMTGGRGGKFRNCYIGATIVHRSGIFATSDMLGNVFGGSDWLTAHLECLL